jgi:hypothetical protein
LGIGWSRRQLRALVGHLEEEQEGELLEVVLVAEAVVAEDVAVAPELLDDFPALAAAPARRNRAERQASCDECLGVGVAQHLVAGCLREPEPGNAAVLQNLDLETLTDRRNHEPQAVTR